MHTQLSASGQFMHILYSRSFPGSMKWPVGPVPFYLANSVDLMYIMAIVLIIAGRSD